MAIKWLVGCDLNELMLEKHANHYADQDHFLKTMYGKRSPNAALLDVNDEKS